MLPKRTLIVLAVAAIAAIVLAVVAGLATRGGGSSAAGVDWSAPAELPPAEASPAPVPVADGVRYEAVSGRVVASEAYRFATGPCGLGSPIDFDGSLWRLDDPSAVPEPLLGHRDDGAIALVDFDRAVYRTSTGVEVDLERSDASVVTTSRCA